MNKALTELDVRLANRTVVVGIYGLGYVGLPLALRFAEVGVKVIGFDIDQNKVELIGRGQSYIERITPLEITAAQKHGLEATTDFSRTVEADALIICVPTPLDRHHAPDLSYVTDTVDALLPFFRDGQLLSLESTTYPGTTEEVLAPRLLARGFTPGVNCALLFSPEREDPGNPNFTTKDIPKVVGGMTPACLELGKKLYSLAIDQVVPVSSPRVAEMSKLLENIHRAVNIGLVNEMKIVADKMGIDIFEVIRAAATKPFGFVPYYPGPGLGGHCIPIDPFYLTWKAKEYGVNTRFIELAGEVNHYMPKYVVEKITEALNNRGKALKNSKILILGIAYKKNIDDTRESPSIEIMDLLVQRGCFIAYSDPHVSSFPIKRDYRFDLQSVPINEASLNDFDCVVLATDHDAFEYELIMNQARLIIDCRGRFVKGINVVAA
ncbi:nucleotide sugar dehydrogenase [Chitinibacter sp. SCUT-21]|uniref:nucleotide sugar dehydrogenase n=1 Tax=Chitinibacter sp. SCUT-21 TaxID=2970891 RepID=UPI0035A6F0D0